MKSVNETGIEWVRNPSDNRPGHSWNPITGCNNHKDGYCNTGGFPCYAFRVANGRVKSTYLSNHNIALDSMFNVFGVYQPGRVSQASQDSFYPRYWHDRVENHVTHENARPLGIFCCDMSDLFGIGIPERWTGNILLAIKYNPQNRYYLLTKQPQNMKLYSPFTDNVWAGVTTPNRDMLSKAAKYLTGIKAGKTFLSIEPLLEQLNLTKIGDIPGCAINILTGARYFRGSHVETLRKIDQIIIGACTGTMKDLKPLTERYPDLTLMEWGNKYTLQPPVEWVERLVSQADQAGVSVFLKENLWPLIKSTRPALWAFDAEKSNQDDGLFLRQEIPV